MNVLFTMTGSWGTGSGTVVEALTGELVGRGHRVGVLYPETEDAPELDRAAAPEAEHFVWPFPLRDGDAELRTFPLMIPDPNPTNFADAPTFRDLEQAQIDLYVRSFSRRLREVVREFRPDVIECQHVWLMPFAVAEAGLPFVLSAHHSDQMGFEHDARIRPYAVRAARAAERVIALTASNEEEILRLYGVPPEKVIVLGNGYDRRVFRPAEVERARVLEGLGLDIPPDSPLVTFAGKLSRTKGVDVLFEANRILQERREAAGEPPVHLLVFGTGRLEDVLDPAHAERYSTEHAHFLGHRGYEAVRDAHNVARCSVMPSRTEGFGLAALEAMGCGLPMVVTGIGAADSYAVGETVPPGDPEALAEAMLKLVGLPDEEWRALSQAALARARTFSWAALVDRRLEIYAELPPVPAPAAP